jgi:hypothetical protein
MSGATPAAQSHGGGAVHVRAPLVGNHSQGDSQMTAVLDQSTNAGNRGSHYNKGADFLYYVNTNPARIWRQPVNPATLMVQQAAKALTAGQAQNLNSVGSADLRWTGNGTSTTSKQLIAQPGTTVVKLNGITALDQITPDALANITWGPSNNILSPEDGQSTVGNFYAVRIQVAVPLPPGENDGYYHYAKVRIFKEGTTTKIEWVTYIVGTKPWPVKTLIESPDPRDIYVNELETEIYVSGGIDTAGYVVKYQRSIGGPLPQYLDGPIPLASELLSPQQMVVDGGDIYVAAAGPTEAESGVFLLQPATFSQVQVVSGITSPIGLLLDKQKLSTTAYISTQTGQVHAVDVSQFQGPTFDSENNQTGVASGPVTTTGPTTTFSLGGSSGFLTWADDAHTAFYAAVVGSEPKIQRIDLVSTSAASELTAADPTLPSPWSVQVFAESSLTAICDSAIYDIERGIPITTAIALGVGLIPFDFINNSEANPANPAPTDGRANTSSAPGYYFSAYPNLAFGGSLSLLINHPGAWNSNLRFYKVSLTNDTQTRNITNGYTDLRWNQMANPPRFESVVTGVQNSAFFPVRNPADLWYNPFLGAIVNTGTADNGHNRLKLEFFDVNKQPVSSASYTRLVYIDNTRSSISLSNLRRGTAATPPAPGDYQAPDACGLIIYNTKNDLIEIDFTAVHPLGVGKYSFSFYRGSRFLFSVTGDLTVSATLRTIKERSPGVPLQIGHLTENCDIANISIGLSVPSPGIINGYGWVNLGSYTSRNFTLAPSATQPATTHTPWPTERTAIETPTLMMGPPLPKK